MWTQRHKAQSKKCEHNGTKQNMWTQRHKAQSKTCEHNGTKHKAKRKHNETKHKQKREQNGTEHKVKHVKRERHKATLVNPFVITLQLYRNVKECRQIRKGSWTCWVMQGVCCATGKPFFTLCFFLSLTLRIGPTKQLLEWTALRPFDQFVRRHWDRFPFKYFGCLLLQPFYHWPLYIR